MARTRSKIVVGLMSCALVNGCSSYHIASLPSTTHIPARVQSEETAEVGSTVRVLLRSGEYVAGRIVAITDKELTLEKEGAYRGTRERIALSREDIQSMEEKTIPTGSKIALASGLAVLAFVVYAVMATEGAVLPTQ